MAVKILGIDPGIARTGWGVVRVEHSNVKTLSFDCITTPSTLPHEERLSKLYQQILQVVNTKKPEQAAVEKLFFNTNVKTALVVAEARGVVLLALSQRNIPVFHYTPLEIKVAVTGYGRAKKRQVQRMIKALLKLDTIPSPDDVADALAVALTHAYTQKPEK